MAIIFALAHGLLSYIGLSILNEDELISSPVRFIYFYIITGSTVGYGDYSPETSWGSIFVAVWVVPGAISIFAFILGKIIATMQEIVGKIMMGLSDFNWKKDHVVIIGYQRNFTEGLIEEIRLEFPQKEIVVGHTEAVSSLFDDKIKAVTMESLSSTKDLMRTGIMNSSHVIVMIDEDDKTISTCLAIDNIHNDAKIVAHFKREESALLIESHCKSISCILSNEVEKMSRAMSDPETTKLVSYLFSNKRHQSNIRSSRVSLSEDSVKAKYVADVLLHKFEANLIGFYDNEQRKDFFFRTPDQIIKNNSVIYYISQNNLGKNIKL